MPSSPPALTGGGAYEMQRLRPWTLRTSGALRAWVLWSAAQQAGWVPAFGSVCATVC